METKKQHKQSQSITFLTPLLISSVSLAIDTRPISSSATIITLSLLMVKQISYCDRQEGREAGGGGGRRRRRYRRCAAAVLHSSAGAIGMKQTSSIHSIGL